MSATATGQLLAGLHGLVVEDETMIFLLIEDMLHEMGCAGVSHATDVREGLMHIDTRRPDFAVLDVNLAGEQVYPIAERLDAIGVPFAFATGYGRVGMPERWAPRPVIQKPFRQETLAAALTSIVPG
jgi:DNA-binding response OmpR family regulator